MISNVENRDFTPQKLLKLVALRTDPRDKFADERQWLCLIATSPELENPIHLYARKNNPDLLVFLQHPPQHPQRYTIALENTGQGHLNRQWQLTRVLTTGWVVP